MATSAPSCREAPAPEAPPPGVVLAAARSVAGRALPPPPPLARDKDGNLPVSIVLFYQYIEPAWTAPEHRAALGFVLGLARKHGVMGRGRCAPEGLNCTLSGSAQVKAHRVPFKMSRKMKIYEVIHCYRRARLS